VSTKKLVWATLATYILLIVTGYLIHNVWLKPLYVEMRDNGMNFREDDAMHHRMWILLAGDLLFAAFFAWIYTRGVEAKAWVGQGIRYGICMTLFAVVPFTLSDYVAYNIPHTLALKWIAAGAIQLILAGLVVAGICKRSPA
jgi:FtsH-binding integral membrane protein